VEVANHILKLRLLIKTVEGKVNLKQLIVFRYEINLILGGGKNHRRNGEIGQLVRLLKHCCHLLEAAIATQASVGVIKALIGGKHAIAMSENESSRVRNDTANFLTLISFNIAVELA